MGRFLTASLGSASIAAFFIFLLALIPSSPGGLWSLREGLGPAAFDPLLSMVLALLILATAFSVEAERLEKSREIAFVSVVVALGAAGRLLFAAAPNVSPVDWLTLCTGMVFGPVTGFSVGAATMLVSNFWLGQGPWTIYQMVGMGTLGALGGFLARWRTLLGPRALAAIGLTWGFIYGVIMSVFWVLMISSMLSWTSFIAYWVVGLPFYILQGVGNAVLLYVLGRRTIGVFERYRKRMFVRLESAPQSRGVCVDL